MRKVGEIDLDIAAIKCKLIELEKERDEASSYCVWTPKVGDVYYTLDEEGESKLVTWSGNAEDEYAFDTGTMGKTEPQVKWIRRNREVTADLRRCATSSGRRNGAFDPTGENWSLYKNHKSDTIQCFNTEKLEAPNSIYFASEADLRTALDTVGFDNIRMYLFISPYLNYTKGQEK